MKAKKKFIKNISDERMIHIRLPKEMHRLVRLQAAEKDITIQKWVVDIIKKELNCVAYKIIKSVNKHSSSE